MADTTRGRGRPRSAKARQAILDAATALLIEHGIDAVSMDELAELAGVSKATVYRWWPSKHLLALDVLFADWDAVAPLPRDTGSLRGDLRSLLRPWARCLSARPYGAVVAALAAEARLNAQFSELWRERFVRLRREPGRAALQRAIDRGELRSGTDVELVLDLLYGPLYHRLLHGHAPVNERVAGAIVDAVMTGIADSAASA
jgi:AcrR family transcriptional regulator